MLERLPLIVNFYPKIYQIFVRNSRKERRRELLFLWKIAGIEVPLGFRWGRDRLSHAKSPRRKTLKKLTRLCDSLRETFFKLFLSRQPAVVRQPVCHPLRPCLNRIQLRAVSHVERMLSLSINMSFYRNLCRPIFLNQFHDGL